MVNVPKYPYIAKFVLLMLFNPKVCSSELHPIMQIYAEYCLL